MKVQWKDEPDEHDYPAAHEYLSLLMEPRLVSAVVAHLRAAPLTHAKAKDVMRAARLPLLAANDPHVATDLDKVNAGHSLSPILLVRGDAHGDGRLIIADGYHRVCAAYHVDYNIEVPCRLVSVDG